MRKKSVGDYKYLVSQYNLVNSYLFNPSNTNVNLEEAVIAFCVVIERSFKLKLYIKNPLLVFDNMKIRDDNQQASIVLKKDDNIETIKFVNSIIRFNIIFREYFTEDETETLKGLYEIRNKLIHSYKEDISIITNEDDVIKKMGAIWEKISSMIVSLFGDDAIKTSIPKKKYLDVELEAALKEEVRKKIDSRSPYSTIMRFADASISFAPENIKDSYGLSEYSPPGEDICPRCGHLTLARRNNYSSYFAHKLTTSGDLYFCRKCNLELTKRELEMAREIRHGEM